MLNIIVGFPRSTAGLFFDDNQQTCLRDRKTLKVFLYTEFCPLSDKQVIASALGQLRINFTCIFKVFQIALVALRLGQFCETLKIQAKLILNCPRAHAITYTKYNFCLHNKYNVFYRITCWLRICLFLYVFCRHLAKLVIFVEVYHCCCYQRPPCSYVYCRQIANFRCVCLSHRRRLIWVRFVKSTSGLNDG